MMRSDISGTVCFKGVKMSDECGEVIRREGE